MMRLRFLLLAFILTACTFPFASETPIASNPTEEGGAVSTPTPTPNPAPSPLPTSLPDAPLGTRENPIVLALPPSREGEISESAQSVTTLLSYLTGFVIVPYAPVTNAEVIEALGAGQIHIAFLAPFPYLLAREKGYADAALATTVFGRDLSAAQFLVNRALVANRTFTLYFDAEAGVNLADAPTALKQFADKKPCWTDPYSATGYVIPLGVLNENGIHTKPGAFVQGHATVIKALYADPQGRICQFGAAIADSQVFVASGYEDAAERVVIVWRTDPIVPFNGVAYSSSLPDEMRVSLSAAFLSITQTEEGIAALRDTFQIDGFKLIDDTFYDPLRRLLQESGLLLPDLVR